MVLESTMICFDNSDYQRNGDYFPTRLNVQKDGINLIGMSKIRANPENNVGFLTYASTVEVMSTLTTDVGRILSKMHAVQPKGDINFLTGVRIAHLVLKHRQSKNHKMRIVVFVGSPVLIEESDLVKLAKKLKKEKVSVDVVSFGEHVGNNELLAVFVNTLNGKDGTGSHLVSVPRGSALSEALITSPIIQGEDGQGGAGLGAGFEFGVDPNEDPELALALRISMEEQRQRQEVDQRRVLTESDSNADGADSGALGIATVTAEPVVEEAMLQRALAASSDSPSMMDEQIPDFAHMTEEEQIAFAMQMSMQDAQDVLAPSTGRARPNESPMDVDEVISDPDFLQSVLENLPGVDPQSEAIRSAVDSLNKDKKNTRDKSDEK